MAKVVKVVTSGFIAWIVKGKVTLAKCAKSGQWIKRASVQGFIDNLVAASVECALSYDGNTYMACDSWCKNHVDRIVKLNSLNVCFDCGQVIGNAWYTIYNRLSTHTCTLGL